MTEERPDHLDVPSCSGGASQSLRIRRYVDVKLFRHWTLRHSSEESRASDNSRTSDSSPASLHAHVANYDAYQYDDEHSATHTDIAATRGGHHNLRISSLNIALTVGIGGCVGFLAAGMALSEDYLHDGIAHLVDAVIRRNVGLAFVVSFFAR